MAGLSVARVPGLMAAAAALATAATSVESSDRMHPVVSPIMFYAANRSLLPSASLLPSRPILASGSICLPSARGLVAADLWSPVPSAQGASHMSLGCLSRKVLPCLIQGASATSSVTGTISRDNECGCLGPFRFPSASVSSPSYIYSQQAVGGELYRLCKVQTSGWMCRASSVQTFCSSGIIPSSSPANLPSFLTFDPSSRLATSSSLFAPATSHPNPSGISSKYLHRWHTPTAQSLESEERTVVDDKPALTVVLLGWLGSEQKHLKKYAEWYNARGIHAVTFTVPMADILNFSMGGRAEEHVERLTSHLSTWLAEESKHGKSLEKQLIFHTFSNTGWLTYGVVLEKLSLRGKEWTDRIKGCVVDSAPSADPDPQVWASGFSAALLKKRSSAATGGVIGDKEITDSSATAIHKSQPRVAESALLALLEKFFSLFLQIPAINQRLKQVVTVLSKQQPACPQLYIYSTADKVIPAKSVESFMEKQRQEGRIVRGCNFQSSPHVDHFRSFPEIYGNQVSDFLEECLHK